MKKPYVTKVELWHEHNLVPAGAVILLEEKAAKYLLLAEQISEPEAPEPAPAPKGSGKE